MLLDWPGAGELQGRLEGERSSTSLPHFGQVGAAAKVQQVPTADYTIAFASLAPWDLDVFIAQADGSDPQPLVPHPDLDYNATFSPDGQWIVFTSHRDGNAELYRVHPDGSALQRLTAHPAFDDAAAFSPDGKRLAFVSNRSGQADISKMARPAGHRCRG
jgi:Tol biopolymer transport system component